VADTLAALVLQFVAGSTLHRERDRPSQLPIHRNGPPGTFVLLKDGLRVSLPTDQIVTAEDGDDHVRVSFGGFEFIGLIEGRLIFQRVRELYPVGTLSPERSFTMSLDPMWVASVSVDGKRAWP
jgi:hypothetical protein